MRASRTQGEFARLHAEHGFRVYPLKPNDKRPLHVGWQTTATSDVERVAYWWREHPTANVGMLVGRGGAVLDAYTPDEADAWGSRLDTTTVSTACGAHFYLAGDARGRRLGPDLELKGRSRRGKPIGAVGAGSVIDGIERKLLVPWWETPPRRSQTS